MADLAQRDTWPGNVVRPLTVAAGFVLTIVLAYVVASGSDWLAVLIAVFLLATLRPWSPR